MQENPTIYVQLTISRANPERFVYTGDNPNILLSVVVSGLSLFSVRTFFCLLKIPFSSFHFVSLIFLSFILSLFSLDAVAFFVYFICQRILILSALSKQK